MQGPGYKRDPTHTVSVKLSDKEWVAVHHGVELARSTNACELLEAGYPRVVYFPPDGVDFDRLSASDTSSYCPFKGEASYWSRGGSDVAWSYPMPYTEVKLIEAYIAFFPDQVSVQEG